MQSNNKRPLTRQQTNSTRRFDAYTTDRHDSSADWRTEHEDIHVDPDGHVLTDGGTRSTRYVLPTEGAVVYDELVSTLGDWDSVEEVREAVVEGTIRSYTSPVDRLSSTRGGEGE